METWLHNSAIQFERENKARTYLIIDTEGQVLAGYFAVSVKSWKLREGPSVSNRVRKHFGAGKKQEASEFTDVSTMLLAQLGKDDTNGSALDLAEILANVFPIVKEAQALIGGGALLVECECNEKLKCSYEAHGFKYLQDSEDSNGARLHQLYMPLKFG